MSELPEVPIISEVLSSEERFAKYFPDLSKQAVLNMLIAYQPHALSSRQLLQHQDFHAIASTMNHVYDRMLESLQDRTRACIDLSCVTDEQLQAVGDYFESIKPTLQKEKTERQRRHSVGGKVVHLAHWKRV